jgi:apolipoprotein N-acyltransferase
MTVHITLVQAAVAVLALVLWSWRSGVTRAERAHRAERREVGPLTFTGQVIGATTVIVGTQWLVITLWRDNSTLLLATLVLPALFAAWAVARALTVTGRVGGHRRDRR